MKRPSYRDYRGYGHGRLTAWVLSISPEMWYGGAIVLGMIIAGFAQP